MGSSMTYRLHIGTRALPETSGTMAANVSRGSGDIDDPKPCRTERSSMAGNVQTVASKGWGPGCAPSTVSHLHMPQSIRAGFRGTNAKRRRISQASKPNASSEKIQNPGGSPAVNVSPVISRICFQNHETLRWNDPKASKLL